MLLLLKHFGQKLGYFDLNWAEKGLQIFVSNLPAEDWRKW
jgi:hypothetical protein